jgi:uncharacterized protein (DUF697 family)/GTP-binding protein EngB required for normal cell division
MDKDFGKFIDDLDIGSILKNFKNFDEQVKLEVKKMKNLNIINIGKTGVGKSTIINAIFCKNLAKTGIGKPVTPHCEEYSIPDSPITIYDSKGLETGEGNAAILDEIYNKIKDQNSSHDTNEYIHICWYCVLADGKRLDGYEIETIEKIRKTIPVVIVLTQAVGGDKTKEFVNGIKKCFNDAPDIIPIMAFPKTEESDFGQINIKSHGLDKLVEKSYDLLPGSVKKTFAAYQNSSVQLKIDSAMKAVVLYSGAVAAAAFQPLPIADAPIMVGIQIAMMANITVCFGFNPENFNFKTILAGMGGPFAAAVVGRTLVSLLKLIPGIGTLAGGVINASTGASITFAIGSIYIGVLSSVVRENGEIDAAQLIEELKRAAKTVNFGEMKKEWEKHKDSYSKSDALMISEEAKKDIGK